MKSPMLRAAWPSSEGEGGGGNQLMITLDQRQCRL